MTFGDSLSDTGNGYRISNHTWPPVPPFSSSGAYTDGLVWSQILIQKYLSQSTLQDFAYGCATTDSLLVQGTMGYNTNIISGNYSIRNSTKPPGVRQQINDYINLTLHQTIDFDRTLYVIWIGINNYYYDPSLTPLENVESIIGCINQLLFFGVRNLVIINQPPFDRFPAYKSDTTNASKILFQTHNQILADKLNETYFSLHTRLNIRLLDIYTFISKIMDNYTAYGFENLDSCWDMESNTTVIINCQNISRRLFADDFHPTSALHTFIAKEFYLKLGDSNSTSAGICLIPVLLLFNIIFVFILNRRFEW